MQEKSWLRFDYLLLLAVLALAAYGIAMIYSASTNAGSRPPLTDSPAFRQLVFAAVGLAGMLVLVFVDYRIFGLVTPFLYAGSLAGLIFVMAVGFVAHGSRRWFLVAGLQFQPSELTKLILIVVLAKYLADREEKLRHFGTLVRSALLMVPPIVLVFLQPDLGTAVLLAIIWLGQVIMAGARLFHLAALAIAAGLAAVFAFPRIAHGYMLQRFETFLDPVKDPLGAGYNVLQSSISVGSGGFQGKGFLAGTQNQLDFLRVKHTDFIFSVLGEELGFVGAMVLFFLLMIVLFRGVRIAAIARDTFGRLVATGVVVMIFVQAFVNIGVNVRLLPVTGVPLPFISYGGSSVITLFLAIGLLESIALRHKRLEF